MAENMKVIESIDEIDTPFLNAVITIGNFDGVHKGHAALMAAVGDKAREIGGTAIVMTFEPHPLKVLRNGASPPLITLYEQKKELIESAGIDVLVCLDFTAEFAALDPEYFVEKILVEKIGMKAIVAGRDYAFGKNRRGNIDFLNAMGKRLGYEVIIPGWIDCNGSLDTNDRISSTRIRETVMSGEVEKASDMLGRFYQIRGEVVKGRNRGGKLLGFPTANINFQDELCPKYGVYAVIAEIDGKCIDGVANIGVSPTFGDEMFTAEAHLFDFSSDIYGKKIRLNFISRLRDEKKFSGLDELSAQIKKDSEKARLLLKKIKK